MIKIKKVNILYIIIMLIFINKPISLAKTEITIVTDKQNIQIEENLKLNINNLPDNTNLSSLRINQEGISPNFNTDIKEYYFIANKEINKLEVTALPQNKNATVTIIGNNNLKMGENIINIKVESEDKTKTAIYKIYVTRTENLDKANANLENLAVRQATLNPEFDSNITQYKIEIANDINKLDILAIPQKENATVKITGNEELKIGKNKIEIIVLAEDGITSKKYVIEAYRRNEEEEVKYQKQEKLEAERLTAILEEKQSENEKNVIEQNNEINQNIEEKNYDTNNVNIIVWAIIICLIIIGIILLFKIKKNRK
ncbi:MAG: cadherin-like beta sandwich domain-containing protein [Clostridia bacterium]|nr:cadherin-like beta sandwich domain-containing protein [Clostridia bacterium]